MDEVFQQLQDKTFGAVSDYIKQEASNYTIFFAAFILLLVVLVIVVFGVMLRKMRDYLW